MPAMLPLHITDLASEQQKDLCIAHLMNLLKKLVGLLLSLAFLRQALHFTVLDEILYL